MGVARNRLHYVAQFGQFCKKVVLRLSEHGDVIETQTIRFVPPMFFSKLGPWYFRYHFGSTFPRNPTKPMFRSLPTVPLMRWRFQHTCRWIWRFRDCLRHSPKGKKPRNWLQET